MKMEDRELELELALSTQTNQDYSSTKNKRSFHESFSDDDDDGVVSRSSKHTLPLLIWDTHTTLTSTDREEEDAVVVGWPPVKSWTKKQGGGSKYVKVEKEGIGIGRKIDLSSHRSYESLTPTLMAMFGNRDENLKLTYQDEEGDWLLAGDVPWRIFLGSVRRLKLVRKEW